MPKPPVKNPGDEILSSEWNQGWDWMQEGSGSGTNADKVDGRDATRFVWADMVNIAIAANWSGWLPIAYGVGDVGSTIIITEQMSGASNIWLGDVHARFGRAVIRERAYARYNTRTVHAVRVITDADNPTYGMQVVQVYITNPHDAVQTITVVRNHGCADITPAKEWVIRYCPDKIPTNVKVLTVQGAGNGAWRLARALTGQAGVGWMSAAEMRAVFPSRSCTALTDDSCADAVSVPADSTSARCYFTAERPVTLSGIKACVSGYAEVTVYAQFLGGDGVWFTAGTVNVSPDGDATWASAMFTPRTATRWRVYAVNHSSSNDDYLNEVTFYKTSSVIITGVPVGSTVRVLDNGGTQLEAARLTDWERDFVLLTTPTAQISEIDITRPDGSMEWLRYPVALGAIDGGALANGDVLSLYPEA